MVYATMAPTIDEYHRRLHSYQKYDQYRFISMHDRAEQAEMQADLLEDQTQKSKESAREVTKGGGQFPICNGCRKRTEHAKECACHIVKYCSKECQGNNWPIHKKTCTTRNKKSGPKK